MTAEIYTLAPVIGIRQFDQGTLCAIDRPSRERVPCGANLIEGKDSRCAIILKWARNTSIRDQLWLQAQLVDWIGEFAACGRETQLGRKYTWIVWTAERGRWWAYIEGCPRHAW